MHGKGLESAPHFKNRRRMFYSPEQCQIPKKRQLKLKTNSTRVQNLQNKNENMLNMLEFRMMH